MIKVLIVDDEKIIREGLKKTIDWNSFQCKVIGDAKNGLEGIRKAKELEPHLVIADIKMPNLNGLDMAMKILEFNIMCKFIIITGYGSFEYAKKAIKIDAIDFIQKPLDDEELVNAIKKAVNTIFNDRVFYKISTEKLLLDIMRDNISGRDEIEDCLLKHKIYLKECNIILFQINTLKYISYYSLEQLVFKNISEAEYFIQCHENIFAIITTPLDASNISSKLQTMVHNYNKIEDGVISFGISEKGQVLDLNVLYDESKRALKNKLYTGEGSINFYADVDEKDELAWEYIIKKEMDFRLMLETLDEEQVKKVIEDVYTYIGDNYTSLESIKQFTMDLVHIIISFKRKNSCETNDLYQYYEQIKNKYSIEGMKDYILEVTLDIIEEINQINVKNIDDGIKYIIDYIDKNYTNNLNLSTLAKEHYLSESYLSKRLKKSIGMSFVEYITFLRMKKAVEFLQSGEYRVMDVAEMVGYADYRYFSKVFKKEMGILPSEFTKQLPFKS